MSKLSEKYIAGFLDADGSIQMAWRKKDRADTTPRFKRCYVGLEFSQLTSQDEVLFRIQKEIGGNLYFNEKRGSTTLKLYGKKAVSVLNRIKKFLVIKRHYANVVLDMERKVFDREKAQIYLREQRKIRSLPLPNYPPRRWLAGYFDGDGCIQVRLPKERRSAQPTFEIVSSDYDAEGVEIIHKAFGGSLATPPKRSHLRQLIITMPPSKAKKIFGHFAKHLIVKKDQVYFILGCASMGHYRDGKSIKEALKQLKAHPHRLNEPKPSVSELLSQVRDISFKDTYRDRQFWKPGRSKAHLVKR